MGTTTLRAVREHPAATPAAPHSSQGHRGHDHFGARVTRARALGLAGAGALSVLALPGIARAGNGKIAAAEPKPIPPNPDLFGFHLNFPAPDVDVSSIFDFNGFVGVTELRGRGTYTPPGGGATQHLWFDVDNRFMVGE